MQTKQCMTEQELVAFDLGSLTGQRYEEIAQHLGSCPECAGRFERLGDQADGVLESLKLDLPWEIVGEDSEVIHLVEAAVALQQTAGNVGEGTVVVGKGAEGKSRQQEQIATWIPQLLAPPQAADELGRLGGYRILRVLGMGGMGVVFQAEDPVLKRLVALKVMSPTSASEASRARFLREAQTMAAVHHDNVVKIFQVGEDRGAPFLAMELLEGQSLADFLSGGKRLSVCEALQIAQGVARGLAAAHSKGLTHRDIKPDNIWLEQRQERNTRRSDAGESAPPADLRDTRVKILDFGLAHVADHEQHLTQSGAILGTPNYLSPEQAEGKAIDARTDQFSLGIVLYEMLNGVKPFARTTLMATLRSISSEAPAELDASVPRDVAVLVRQMLEKRAADRYPTCEELIAAIEQCQQAATLERPVVEKPKARRKWMLAAAAAVVLLLGVIVTVRDKNGNVVARVFAPDGAKVDVEPGAADSLAKDEPTDAVSPRSVQPVVNADIADHLPAMSPVALVQRPPRLASKKGEVVQSWTVLPAAIQGHPASALSFDGQLLATFGSDGAVRVWDVERQALHKVLIGHAAGPCSPAGKPVDRTHWGYVQTNSRRFGPLAWRPRRNAESPWLATASRDGSVRMWDVAKGTTVWIDSRAADLINMLAWSPDGMKLAVGYEDGQVRTWEADGGKELPSLSLAEGPPLSLAWSPNSQFLAVHVLAGLQTVQGVFVVWDVVAGKSLRLDSPGIQNGTAGGNSLDGVSAMRWSPDGEQLAVRVKDGLSIHETTSWKPTHRLISPLKDAHVVQDFDWSSDGTSVLVSWSGKLQLHDLKANKLTPVPLKDKQMAHKIEWAPGSTRVALWNLDGIHSYSAILDTQTMDVRSLQDRNAFVYEFSSDGTRLLGRNADTPGVFKLKADNVTYWQPPHQPGVSQRVSSPVWSPDGQWMSHGISFWNSQERDWARSKCTFPESSIVSWSPDSSRFMAYTAGRGSHYEFWSPQERKRLAKMETSLTVTAWSPDGSQLAIGGGSIDEVRVLDGKSGQVLRKIKVAGTTSGPVSVIAWSKHGERLAVFTQNGGSVIDVMDGNVRFALEGTPAGSAAILWGPDDRRLLVVGAQELSVFDGDSGKYQTGFSVGANSRAIHFLDRDSALCGTRDGFVHRLDLASGKHEVVTRGLGNIVEISPDGQQLAVDRGSLSIYHSDGRLQSSFLSLNNDEPFIISADGHFWSNDQSQGPFWATKGSVPHTLVYVVQTNSGQQTLTPLEFANRYGWRNDPSQVRLK